MGDGDRRRGGRGCKTFLLSKIGAWGEGGDL